MATENEPSTKHFIEQRIEADIENNTYGGGVVTRFPPEPNGYLHIGHAKSICLNFTMAAQYQGRCHLRFDDTNPMKEETRFVEAIKEDVRWLGFQWDSLHHAADYFGQLYDFAIKLISEGKAYVCSLPPDKTREMRGTLTEPGQNSPYRERAIEENLALFEKMRQGVFKDGEHCLRAKIDMASGNMNMRDPVMYRIMNVPHQHTKEQWSIYPMYDYAHCLSDAIENITHSLCTLEFQDHRPLYDWFVEALFPKPRPQQIEFSRLNLSHTITSKRKLKALVDENRVDGWDDPRMPTIVGLRRRGFTANSIRNFCEQIGISKSDSIIDMSLLEECLRDDLNEHANRVMCVLNPLKVTITNLEPNHSEQLQAPNHPQNESMGQRKIPFTQTVYIEKEDFMEEPVKKFKRLSPGKEVRLRYGYVICCDEVIKDDSGEIIELKCSVDKDTLGKNPEGRKVKGVIHWVSATENFSCEVREFDRLFIHENPAAAEWNDELFNPASLVKHANCYIEKGIQSLEPETSYQFERQGYFVIDRHDSKEDCLVFNKTVGLRDSWAKLSTN